MQKIFLAGVFLFIFLIFSSEVFAQTGVCGSESISAGAKGEVRLRTQSGGTDLNYDVCWPKACSAGMAASTVVSDKYISISAPAFAYQKICMADVDSLNLNECSSLISNESGKCSPQKCEAGFFDFGLLSEKRDKSGNLWTENVYRLCGRGSKIENATLVFNESVGSAPLPEKCPAGFDDAGIFREIHFNTSETQRAWRICVQFKAQGITTTTAASQPNATIINATTPIANATATTLASAATTLKATTTTSITTTISKTTSTYPATTFYTTTTFYPPLPPEKKSACADSDAGIAIHSAGSVRVENGTLYLDACVENNLINEYYCSNGTASIYMGNCTAGCLNSACRGAGEALAEKGALFAGRIIDTLNYVVDLVARGKILERGADLVGKVIDTASSFLDFFSKLIGKGSQYVDTIEIENKTANATNITNSTG